ncbi:YopX family protein [Vagococcus fluvialis]|uniref:YopX family protein n=1 Tax=Vagococcus fluvialis TaxID=2738 RepID=UPI003B20DC31
MREIKFRAWCKLDKILYDWEQVKKEFTLEYFDDRGLIFQQFTGLKDKNDVEIYEGDIVANPNNQEKDDWYISHHVVELYDTGFMGKQICSFGSRIGLEHWTRGENGYVVIGNIYENPELLKTKKSS